MSKQTSKNYEGFITFLKTTAEWCRQYKLEDLIYLPDQRLAFDFKESDCSYTVSIKKIDDFNWSCSYTRNYQGETYTEKSSCEVFTRQNGSYLIFGIWREENETDTFFIELDEL